MKIAILDNINEDIGLKILFPEADYYICDEKPGRTSSYEYYNFQPLKTIENITDKNYDILFIIMPLRHIINNEIAVKNIRQNYENKIKKIVDENEFKLILFFDNEDYYHDPNQYLPNIKKNTYIFKRNYDKKEKYLENVLPFPFIMFGYKSLIEKIDTELVSKEIYFGKKQDVVFFTGGLYIHDKKEFDIYVNRIEIYKKISRSLFNPGHMNNELFMNTLRNSKFALDLTGAGNPNIRTIEILVSGALMLQQKNDLLWPFYEQFSEECLFTDENDYFIKLNNLQNNGELYNKCLENQYTIINKYFNKDWLRNYIESFINNKI